MLCQRVIAPCNTARPAGSAPCLVVARSKLVVRAQALGKSPSRANSPAVSRVAAVEAPTAAVTASNGAGVVKPDAHALVQVR